jgi:DNA-binding MarR family transcriptional regulator
LFEAIARERTLMTSEDRKQKIDRFADLSHAISTQLHIQMETEWPEYELSMPQFKAMVCLAGGRKRMGDLARLLDISLSSATNLADRLESKGLVTRDHDHHDRRVVTCELTADGHDTISRFWKVGRQRIEDLTSHLSDAEFDLVLHALEMLVDSWQRASGDSPSSSQPTNS